MIGEESILQWQPTPDTYSSSRGQLSFVLDIIHVRIMSQLMALVVVRKGNFTLSCPAQVTKS